MSDDRNKNLVGSKLFGSTEECPSLDELIADAEGHRGEEPRARVEAHLAGCSHCKNELAMFREFESPAIRPEEKAPVDYIAGRLRANSPVERNAWWKNLFTVKVWAPAMVAMAALAFFLWVPRQDAFGPDLSGENGTLRSGRITVTSPAATGPTEFRWQAVPGAARYTVQLFDVDNTSLWDTAVDATSVTLPVAVQQKLVGSKAANWRVTAQNAAGATVADSGVLRFPVSH